MSDPVSALGHATFDGFAGIREIGPVGMISLRADLADPATKKALKAAGFDLPAQRQVVRTGSQTAGWMSPDELLLITDYSAVAGVTASLTKSLKAKHFLATDLSDARAVFRITGPKADQVLAKLCPVDLGKLAQNELRRTRAAQVAAAFWREEDGFTLVSFRSVAAYVMGLLEHSAQPGSEF